MSDVKFLCLFFISLFAVNAKARPDYFDQGSQEFGLSNIGIGYSTLYGLEVQATTRYQYYVLNRVALGGSAFYNQVSDKEFMGIGPVASWIFATYRDFFTRVDQQVTLAKFNGFDDRYSTFYGTSALSLNYLQPDSNFSIGLGYALNYALSSGKVIRPNTVQLFIGLYWD